MDNLKYRLAYLEVLTWKHGDGIEWLKSLTLCFCVHHLHDPIQRLWKTQLPLENSTSLQRQHTRTRYRRKESALV